MAEEFRVLKPLQYHKHFFSEGTRLDGRPLMSAREIKCETDAINTADASALVKLGNTSVVCGCIVSIEPKDSFIPTNNSTDSYEVPITIKVELPPICSNPAGFNNQLTLNRPSTTTAYLAPSKQSETAVLLTRQINQIFIDSRCLDMSQLRIKHTEYLWKIDVEVICLNYDGSLIDCALIAVLKTLMSLQLPHCTVGDDSVPKITASHQPSKGAKLEFKAIPISTSYSLIEDITLCDPTLEEENISQSTFSITVDSSSSEICDIYKVGGASFTLDVLDECIKNATRRSMELSSLLFNDIRQ